MEVRAGSYSCPVESRESYTIRLLGCAVSDLTYFDSYAQTGRSRKQIVKGKGLLAKGN